jgi:predicted signal transduction protein with EAL and GGDEF domain
MNTIGGIPTEAQDIRRGANDLHGRGTGQHLIERLEVHFLANQDDHIYFALLGDFPDAAVQQNPEDAQLLATAQSGIEDLNRPTWWQPLSPLPSQTCLE